jgi:hypothetical protein
MPIEINELVIRVRVDSNEGNTRQSQTEAGQQTEEARTEVVERAVAEVMDLLKRKKER